MAAYFVIIILITNFTIAKSTLNTVEREIRTIFFQFRQKFKVSHLKIGEISMRRKIKP